MANNLTNIIPNPILNNKKNNKYYNYCTSDIDGITNTQYLRKYIKKTNISNKISNEYYVPSIGELGIAMQNIQNINNTLISYAAPIGMNNVSGKLTYINHNIVSSTLYSKEDIINNNYVLDDSIEYVWYYNYDNGKIAYNNINNQYLLLPFFKYDINKK